MDFKESRTWANLMSAFAGESQARVKYMIYAEKAKEQGYEVIADIFRATSDNEHAHATLWLQAIHEGMIPDTLANLRDAAAGENFEWSSMYRDYAQVAREEGYTQLAAAFELVSRVEKEHEERYNALTEHLDSGTLYKRGEKKVWICRYCGHIHEGDTAPKICPLCKRAQGFFEVHSQNY
ncbi:MAG: rubrerythrin family protein [Clostridiales bacterium]|nr:rubrerythrin family protein [Clostridiales bacterium]